MTAESEFATGKYRDIETAREVAEMKEEIERLRNRRRTGGRGGA